MKSRLNVATGTDGTVVTEPWPVTGLDETVGITEFDEEVVDDGIMEEVASAIVVGVLVVGVGPVVGLRTVVELETVVGTVVTRSDR